MGIDVQATWRGQNYTWDERTADDFGTDLIDAFRASRLLARGEWSRGPFVTPDLLREAFEAEDQASAHPGGHHEGALTARLDACRRASWGTDASIRRFVAFADFVDSVRAHGGRDRQVVHDQSELVTTKENGPPRGCPGLWRAAQLEVGERRPAKDGRGDAHRRPPTLGGRTTDASTVQQRIVLGPTPGHARKCFDDAPPRRGRGRGRGDRVEPMCALWKSMAASSSLEEASRRRIGGVRAAGSRSGGRRQAPEPTGCIWRMEGRPRPGLPEAASIEPTTFWSWSPREPNAPAPRKATVLTDRASQGCASRLQGGRIL